MPFPARHGPLFLLIAFLFAAGGLEAQPAGLRVQGIVTSPRDEPVAGAVVRLFRTADAAASGEQTRTDDKGRWTLRVPEGGRWEIEIRAEGFLDSDGWIQVLTGRATPRVEVELRALEEGTPAFLEGDRTTIRRWIERANQLLEQGRTSEARGEYQKALDALPIAERPDVLQAIARTHFLEQNHDEAVAALEQALHIDPGNSRLRQLYRVLLTELGRQHEIEDRLEAIEAAPPSPSEAEPPQPPPGPAFERPPIEPTPTPGRVGHFRTRLPEPSPLSDMEIYLQRFGLTADEIRPYDSAVGSYDLAAESFDVFVPEAYDGTEPYGLFVFISPTPFGGFTKEEIARALTDRRLIWVGADDAGNNRSAWYRTNLALDAVHNLRQLYAVDSRRIYVSGYSGGGRVASAMTLLYPEYFTGGLFLYGTDWYEPIPVRYRPGSTWPARFPRPDKRRHEIAKAERRLVFLTGEHDFNRPQTKSVYRQAVEDGFAHATYLEIPGADHYAGIDGEWLERGLAALDAPLDGAD